MVLTMALKSLSNVERASDWCKFITPNFKKISLAVVIINSCLSIPVPSFAFWFRQNQYIRGGTGMAIKMFLSQPDRHIWKFHPLKFFLSISWSITFTTSKNSSLVNIPFSTNSLVKASYDTTSDIRSSSKETTCLSFSFIATPPLLPLFSPLDFTLNLASLFTIINIAGGRDIPSQFPMSPDDWLKIFHAELPPYHANRESFRKIDRISPLCSFWEEPSKLLIDQSPPSQHSEMVTAFCP